jgi:hypothetical protein
MRWLPVIYVGTTSAIGWLANTAPDGMTAFVVMTCESF